MLLVERSVVIIQFSQSNTRILLFYMVLICILCRDGNIVKL